MTKPLPPDVVRYPNGRGRSFAKGTDSRRNLKGRPPENIQTFDDSFFYEFFKEVDAKKGELLVRASQYKLFMEQMIQHGIKGKVSDRRLVLEFFIGAEARRAKMVEQAKATMAGGTGNFDWTEAQERLLQGMKDVVAEEAKRE